ncbi:MAG: CvpA family protein [Sedimentisphaerales bacterium]|nr:CvpA family protein [Sedimentisphaerales bacterium]
MVCWIGILIAVGFAYSAIKLGFYQAWTVLFNVIISVYLGIRLGPSIEEFVPVGGQYSATIALAGTAVGAFLILQGISYAFLLGQIEVSFPRVFNVLGAGLFGFLAGFLISAFAMLVFCTTPLSQNDYVKEIGLGGETFEQTKMQSYIAWWCSAVDKVALMSNNPDSADKAIRDLIADAAVRNRKSRSSKTYISAADVNTPPEPNYTAGQPKPTPLTEIPP